MSREGQWVQALLNPDDAAPSGLKSWNGSSTTDRFAVYRNNVVTSLTNALAETFDVTRQLVGDDFFHAMAAVFVRQSPPNGARLIDYGEDFPSFIARFPPAQSVPYLADVARLEHAYIQAYHAADCRALSPAEFETALAAVETDGAFQLRLHPALYWQRSEFAVVSIWSAHQGNGAMEEIDIFAPEHAWVFRCGLEVAVFHVRPGDHHFAARIAAGALLQDAATSAVDADPEFHLPTCLATMLRDGMITAVAGQSGD